MGRNTRQVYRTQGQDQGGVKRKEEVYGKVTEREIEEYMPETFWGK